MHRRPFVLRLQGPYRFLQTDLPVSVYVFTGGGPAALVQHHIFSSLYDSEGPNLDLVAFGLCAVSLQLVTCRWRQVDTPSVASPASELSDFDV